MSGQMSSQAAGCRDAMEALFEKREKYREPLPRSAEDICGDLAVVKEACDDARRSMMAVAREHLEKFDIYAEIDFVQFESELVDTISDATFDAKKSLQRELDHSPSEEIPGQREWAASRGF